MEFADELEALTAIAEMVQSIESGVYGLLSVCRAAAVVLALVWASHAWRDLRTVIREGVM